MRLYDPTSSGTRNGTLFRAAPLRRAGRQDHRHSGKRQAERRGDAARGRGAVRGAAWLHRSPGLLQVQRQCSGAGGVLAQAAAEVDFLITGLGD